MRLVARVSDFPHIGLLLRKVLEGVGLKILDPLHTGELVLVPLHIQVGDLLYDGKQIVMRLIDDLHTDAEFFLPLYLLHTISLLFPRPQASGRQEFSGPPFNTGAPAVLSSGPSPRDRRAG